MFSSPKRKIEKYFRKNPQVKSIVVAGSYGRKSAIRALSALLGETYLVTMGVNKNVQPDVVVLDYGSMSDFPDIQPDLTIVTSCRSDDEAKQFFEVANKSRKVLVNFSDVPQEYAKYLTIQRSSPMAMSCRPIFTSKITILPSMAILETL